MSVPPRDPAVLEPERYELAGEAPYRFELQRRELFKLIGGGLIVGVIAEPSGAQESGRGGRGVEDVPDEIGAWLHVDEQGRIAVFSGKAELGQNIRTSLTQAVSDELHVAADAITVVMADTARTPFDAGTFGSRTTPFMAPQLRRAAAAARAALIDLAAARWQVEPAAVDASGGRVRHLETGRTATYGELTKGQRLARVIGDVTTLPRDEWRLAGAPVPKTDGRAFVTGRHEYVSDMTRPQLVHGAVVRAPAPGAALASCDTAEASAQADVRVVRDGDFVGVTAPDATRARRAASLVRAEWSAASPVAGRELFEHLRRSAEPPESATPVHASGSIDEGRRLAARTLEATYTVAYIAHVPLEPRAAVAEWGENALTVWTGTQRPFGVRRELADAFHLPVERVRVIVPDTGSAYGGKHTGETAIEAARLAKAASRPVKVTWTREEEFASAYFRPAGVIDVRSGLDADGRLTFWTVDNINSGAAGIRTPYTVPHQRIAFLAAQSPLRQGSYRGLAATANNFARECQMDELAHLAGVDPVQFRIRHLQDARLTGVLQAVAERIGWPSPGGGAHFGIACGFEKSSYVATAVSLALEARRIVLKRIVCAFDCGAVVNPNGLRNQVEGALVQGIGGALFEAVEFENNRITNGKLSQYRVPRWTDVPPIDVLSIEPAGAPSVGAGETPIIALAPAIAGAVFSATGRRVRGLPIERALAAADA
jgi:nicotinate dehydrogenase subunit B